MATRTTIQRVVGNSGWKSNAHASDFSMEKKLLNGFVPPSLLGAEGLNGSSMLSSVAHRGQQMNKLKNLLDNGVDDELQIVVRDKKGAPVITPYMLDGQLRYPNDKGVVRITNTAPVELAKQVKEYEEDQTDKLMDLILISDEVAAYIVGLTLDEWTNVCDGATDPTGAQWRDPGMRNMKCTVDHISQLVSGSIKQTQSIGKLRRIAKHYLKNVNLDSFDSLAEKKADMTTGKNTVRVEGKQKNRTELAAEIAEAQAQMEAAQE